MNNIRDSEAATALTHSDTSSGERVFRTIPKSRGEEVRIGLSSFKGRIFVAVRIWFRGDDGQMRPSNKGVNLPVDKLPELHGALDETLRAAISEGLVK